MKGDAGVLRAVLGHHGKQSATLRDRRVQEHLDRHLLVGWVRVIVVKKRDVQTCEEGRDVDV